MKLNLDFEKLAQGLRRYGRVLVEDADGKVFYLSCNVPAVKSPRLSEPNEKGFMVLKDRYGNWLGGVKIFPSRAAFLEHIYSGLAGVSNEEIISTLIEMYDVV